MFYRFQQFLILVAHFLLLGWMIYALRESGTLSMTAVLLHFIGMGIYGGALIRGTAAWANYHHQKKTPAQLNH